jgi:hypothetical protein
VSELQQKIKFLEAEITAEKASLQINYNLIKKHITTPQFIFPMLIGCVLLGYYLPHRKHIPGTIPTALIKNLQLLLPMIIA